MFHYLRIAQKSKYVELVEVSGTTALSFSLLGVGASVRVTYTRLPVPGETVPGGVCVKGSSTQATLRR